MNRLLILYFILISTYCKAQYEFNPISFSDYNSSINPAQVAIENNSVNFNYFGDWTKLLYSPQRYLVFGEYEFQRQSSGLGAYVFSDLFSNIGISQLGLNYRYKIQLERDNSFNLFIGLGVNYSLIKYNIDSFNPRDLNDDQLNFDSSNSSNFNSSAGIFLKKILSRTNSRNSNLKYFSFGFSLRNLIPSQLIALSANEIKNEKLINALIEYSHPLNDINFTIRYQNTIRVFDRQVHSVILRTTLSNNTILINLGYTSTNKIISGFGLQIKDNYENLFMQFDIDLLSDMSEYALNGRTGLILNAKYFIDR